MFICIHEIVFQAEAKRVLCVRAETKSLSVLRNVPTRHSAQTWTSQNQLQRNQENKHSLVRSFAIFVQEICPQTGGALSNSIFLNACLSSLEAALFFPDQHQQQLAAIEDVA